MKTLTTKSRTWSSSKLLLCLTLTLLGTFANASSEQSPNVVFIIADDLNDFIGPLNDSIGIKTPNLDKLAEQGSVFTNAHSNAPICAPSRASLLAGIYPHHSGQYSFTHWRKNPVLLHSKTFMEALSEHGYFTTGTGKVMHHQWPKAWDEFGIRPDYTPLAFNGKKPVQHPDVPAPYNQQVGPLDSTFIKLSSVPNVAATNEYPGHHGWYYGGFKKPFRYINETNRDPLPDEMYAKWTVNKIKQLEKQPIKQPFLITTGFIRPHTPLVVPDRFFDLYPIDNITLPTFFKGDDLDTHFESIYGEKGSKGRKHFELLMASFKNKQTALKQYYQAYMASVSFVDEQIGKILTAIEQSKFADNTIIIVTSDHGYNLGEKDNLFKNNLWERSTKVPLLIYDPRHSTTKRIDEAVSLIDIYPTLMELTGAEVETRKSKKGKALDGMSLVPLLRGNNSQTRTALTVVQTKQKGRMANFALRTKHWRYIRYFNGKEELYHNQNDPGEIHNLAEMKQHQMKKAELKQQLLSLTKDAI